MKNGRQDPNLNLDQLFAEAHNSKPSLDNLGAEIIKQLRHSNPGLFDQISYEEADIKSVKGATEKIRDDYNGVQSNICDLTRGRIVVNTPEQVSAIRDHLDRNQTRIGIEKSSDHFAEPTETDFRDINMKVRLDTGHVAELRIEHKGLLEASKETHPLYKELQNTLRLADAENRYLSGPESIKVQQLLNTSRNIHNKAAQEGGLNPLLNDKGRTKLMHHKAERTVTQDKTPDKNLDNKPGNKPEKTTYDISSKEKKAVKLLDKDLKSLNKSEFVDRYPDLSNNYNDMTAATQHADKKYQGKPTEKAKFVNEVMKQVIGPKKAQSTLEIAGKSQGHGV